MSSIFLLISKKKCDIIKHIRLSGGKMMNSVSILGVSFSTANQAEASEIIFTACKSKNKFPLTVVTPNPLMVMNAQRNETLFSALSHADLSLADGVGIISAARRMCTPLPERVTGIDTGYAVLKKLEKIGGSVYLLGARPDVAEKAAEKLTENLPCLHIVGTHHGYFGNDEEIIRDISEKSPDLLIVCLGSPRQEIWAHQNKANLSGVGAIMCLGGALDVWAGKVKRAPAIFIKLHLEWLWRMICEPKRFSALPKMIKFRILTGKSRQNKKSFK
jgi:N-acetylglucosaminyldiphosphoundecaprenol N-acetyl-beta-D-mannosaminyltransferase